MIVIDLINTLAEWLGLILVWGTIATFAGFILLGLWEGITGGWWGR